MIKLYRKEKSMQADAIEAEFRDMILGYDRVVIAEQDVKQIFGAGGSLPVTTNNDKTVSGEEIPAYIEELRGLMRDWQRFQVDSCYVDEDERFC